MITRLFLFLLLSLFWFVLSGHREPFFLISGFASVSVTMLILKKFHCLPGREMMALLHPRNGLYPLWLLKEIILSGWDVTKRVLQPSMPVSPTFSTLTATQKTDAGRTIYAHSITLTPGTVCVDVLPGQVKVHALSASGIEVLHEGAMDRKVTVLEGEKS